MIYEVANPPFSLDFRKMSKDELKQYSVWYISNIENRVNQLQKLINQKKNNEKCTLNYTYDSLICLGKWFCTIFKVRDRTNNEILEIKNSGNYSIDVEKKVPNEITYSIAYDIGMYLCNFFLKNHSNLKMGLDLVKKNSLDYGQPVITGFSYNQVFNPHYMIVIQAKKMVNELNPNFLIELYDFWVTNSILK
ncbi:hypothetical protein AY606_15415 [Acinetobacter sp. SFB]|uniref:hypothetical protein n=1 Tax=Acinetobacter sp. SFB TaxID=1805634 RepID=UPI0007D7DDB9|nr:hypothetical protein [Acinetobacter sp. SFB]OAL80406.1 hypothetical protein AY606_15415 [Acinetobacter sp. SFB]